MFTHHRMPALGWPALALLPLLALGGCQSTQKPAPVAAVHSPGNQNPSLVMLPDNSRASGDELAAWESSRNDAELGMLNPPLEATFGVAVIRQYENLGTSNGQARDNSWTYSQSVRSRMGP